MKSNPSPFFSVIVACYNAKPQDLFLTLDSCARQKNVQFEIIIADDGSDKPCRPAVLHWQKLHPNIPVSFSELAKNQGTVINLLTAANKANGTYIKFISPADFFVTDNALSSFGKALKKAPICYSSAIFYTIDHKISWAKPQSSFLSNSRLWMKRNVYYYMDHFLGACFAGETTVLRKLLTKISGHVRYCEDIIYDVFAFLEGIQIAYINKNLLFYEHGSGISTSINHESRMGHDIASFYQWFSSEYQSNPNAKKHIQCYQKITNGGSLLSPLHFLYKASAKMTQFYRRLGFRIHQKRNRKVEQHLLGLLAQARKETEDL